MLEGFAIVVHHSFNAKGENATMTIDRELDNRGLSCPMPVINTRKALMEMGREGTGKFVLLSIVDNEAALENVTRMISKDGCRAKVSRKEDGIYIYISPVKRQGDEACSPDEKNRGAHEKTTVLITSSRLGEGKDELGMLLMRSLFFSLHEAGFSPAQIIFLNSGVFLTVEKSPILDELKELERKGVQLLSCGTCLDYYQLKDKLVVGRITNMYDIAELLRDSAKCLTL